MHVGRIFDICVEKGSELPLGDPARKYKGRVVFQGNQVKDENWEVAMFQDLFELSGNSGGWESLRFVRFS